LGFLEKNVHHREHGGHRGGKAVNHKGGWRSGVEPETTEAVILHLTLIESDATDGISALVDFVSTIEFGASKLELVAFMLLALHCP
jgi:hypothetical protein